MTDDIQQDELRDSGQARKICLGQGEKFKKYKDEDKKCVHFDATLWECKLLRNKNPIRAVYGQRCLSELEFYLRARGILKKYPDNLKGEYFDLTDFIHGRHDGKNDFKGILDEWVFVPAIHYMYSIINKRLSQYIDTGLKKRKLVPGQKTCGTCIHRSPDEPHVCELEKFPQDNSYNPSFGTERESSESACKKGYALFAVFHNPLNEKSCTQNQDGEIVDSRRESKVLPRQIALAEALRDVPRVFKALEKCAKNAHGKEAEVFKRWLEDNLQLFNLFCEYPDISEYEAKGKLRDMRTKGKSKKERDAYSEKLRVDLKNLKKCISGEMDCQSKVDAND